jgi:hypothetical protein
MTTLLDMRDRVREFVRDTRANSQKVTDAELDSYIRDAIADYSRHFPRVLVTTIDPPGVPVSPPADMLPSEDAVVWVEVDSALWQRYILEEGSSIPTSGKLWYWRGGEVMLATTPTTPITLHYHGLHLMPSQDGDTLTVPQADEELIELYAAAKFHQKMGTVSAKLDRFKERGERDDNPLVLMHEVLMKRYDQMVADRMHRGTVRIRRR